MSQAATYGKPWSSTLVPKKDHGGFDMRKMLIFAVFVLSGLGYAGELRPEIDQYVKNYPDRFGSVTGVEDYVGSGSIVRQKVKTSSGREYVFSVLDNEVLGCQEVSKSPRHGELQSEKKDKPLSAPLPSERRKPVNVTLTDGTPPTISTTSPTNGQTFTTAWVTVSGTASDPGTPSSGVALVEVRLNGGSWLTASGTASWSKAVTLASGPNVIDARSKDGADNYSSIASVNAHSSSLPEVSPEQPSKDLGIPLDSARAHFAGFGFLFEDSTPVHGQKRLFGRRDNLLLELIGSPAVAQASLTSTVRTGNIADTVETVGTAGDFYAFFLKRENISDVLEWLGPALDRAESGQEPQTQTEFAGKTVRVQAQLISIKASDGGLYVLTVKPF